MAMSHRSRSPTGMAISPSAKYPPRCSGERRTERPQRVTEVAGGRHEVVLRVEVDGVRQAYRIEDARWIARDSARTFTAEIFVALQEQSDVALASQFDQCSSPAYDTGEPDKPRSEQ